MSEKILKKRGRKPKNKLIEQTQSPSPLNSEEDTIIAHLPIKLEDIADAPQETYIKDDIFIKSEKELIKPNTKKSSKKNKEEEIINQINKKIIETEKVFMIGKNVNRVNVYNMKFGVKTKCFWCRHNFNHPGLEMPEDYYNETFYCSGYYCSWNCMKAHNTDMNDTNSSKRESLINLMYYKTYGEFKDIISAGSWMVLEDYGGYQSIEDFRKNFDNPNKEFLVLHPPIMTRQLQIEESYKKSTINNTHIPLTNLDILNNMNDANSELVLKRSKPLESASFSLEKTIGLKRKKLL
jgi:hypothetical protein